MSFFDLALLTSGVIGILGGAWPLLTGRNFPGLLGRGFTRSDNLRLQRAPAVYFRAMGLTIATAGLLIGDVGLVVWLAAGPPLAGITIVAVVGSLAGIAFMGSLAWLLVLTYRHKLFGWNAP